MKSQATAILMAQGTNCHEETQWAVKKAGGQADLVLLQDLLDGRDNLAEYSSLIIPGGFSFGDHVASGRIEAIHLVYRLRDQIAALVAERRPILGICNGFQVLVETGLLPGKTLGQPELALVQNTSAHFEHHWIRLGFKDSGSFWTRNLAGQILVMPVAHGEGKMHIPTGSDTDYLVSCQYVSAAGCPTEEYPYNPNGSPQGIAGIIDSTGLIFGLMPHPERAIESWQNSQDGLLIFENLVSHLLER